MTAASTPLPREGGRPPPCSAPPQPARHRAHGDPADRLSLRHVRSLEGIWRERWQLLQRFPYCLPLRGQRLPPGCRSGHGLGGEGGDAERRRQGSPGLTRPATPELGGARAGPRAAAAPARPGARIHGHSRGGRHRGEEGHAGCATRPIGPTGLAPRRPALDEDGRRLLPGAEHAAQKSPVAGPGIAVEGWQLRHPLRPQGGELERADHLQPVGGFLHPDRLVPSLPEVAVPRVPSVEGTGVTCK
jgi:hypothetical protein